MYLTLTISTSTNTCIQKKTLVRHRGYIYGKEKIRHVCTSVEVARDIKSNIFNPRHSE